MIPARQALSVMLTCRWGVGVVRVVPRLLLLRELPWAGVIVTVIVVTVTVIAIVVIVVVIVVIVVIVVTVIVAIVI